jgi:hypothetical protein
MSWFELRARPDPRARGLHPLRVDDALTEEDLTVHSHGGNSNRSSWAGTGQSLLSRPRHACVHLVPDGLDGSGGYRVESYRIVPLAPTSKGHARKNAATQSDEKLRKKRDKIKHDVRCESIIRYEECSSYSRSQRWVGYQRADSFKQIERGEQILIHRIEKFRITGAEHVNVDRGNGRRQTERYEPPPESAIPRPSSADQAEKSNLQGNAHQESPGE